VAIVDMSIFHSLSAKWPKRDTNQHVNAVEQLTVGSYTYNYDLEIMNKNVLHLGAG